MSVSAAETILASGGPDLSALMIEIEARLRELTAEHGPLLARHAGDTVTAGGKRLRPLLVGLSAGRAAADHPGWPLSGPGPGSTAPTALVRSATAVELIHAATLVHDDVLDRADTRRGRPTVVAAAGREMAVATGDLLFSRAFAELSLIGSAAAVRILSAACSQLATGELMQRADAYSSEVSLERYFERCRRKTAVLFRAACELGALVAGEAPERLGDFGEAIGLAFQILDDVLDVSGPPQRTGKPRGTDLLDGTVTLPMILARASDSELAALDLRGITGTEAAVAAVCDRIVATGALEDCRTRAMAVIEDAKALISGLEEPRRAALELIAEGVVERYA